MQWLARVCVDRPVFAWVLMLVITVFGIFGLKALGLDELPNADFPVVLVTSTLRGAAPEEMETDVSDKIEAAVATVSGIDQMTSSSSEGVSQVVLTFNLEKNGDVAAQEVRDRVSSALIDLPKGMDPPNVSKLDLNAAPILLIALRGNLPPVELSELADKTLRRNLESLGGVGRVQLVGARKREVRVRALPEALEARGLTMLDVARAIGEQNVSFPAGAMEEGKARTSLRVLGRMHNAAEVEQLVIKESAGRSIRLGEVAAVADGPADVISEARYDETEAVLLSVRKQSGANTVAVVDQVLERIDELRKQLPPGVTLELVRDASLPVRTGIHSVTEHLIVGAILAALIVLLFLGNVRSTVIAALAIPISIVGTFGLMVTQGFTLNFLTLLALALAVGIVIDDAIVVLENVLRFMQEKKMAPREATLAATKQIGLAVLATTLSLIAVFLPVAFMPGLVGRFLKSFGVTMVFAIVLSLIVSFSLTPSLTARWLRAEDGEHGQGRLGRFVDAFYKPVERTYLKVLGLSLRHRWVVVALCALSLASTVPVAQQLPAGFLPADDRAEFEVLLRLPEGTGVAETRLFTERVAIDLRRALPEVEHVLLTVAGDELQTSNLAKLNVMLTPPKERDASQTEIMQRAREGVLSKLDASIRVSLAEVQGVSSGEASQTIQYSLTGKDYETLTRLSTQIVTELKKVPGAVDVDSSLVVGKPELHYAVDRDRAADLGVRVSEIGQTLQLLVAGEKVGTISADGESRDVHLKGAEEVLTDSARIEQAGVPSTRETRVPLSAVLTGERGMGPGTINRLNRKRQVTVLANSAPGVGDNTIDAELMQIVQQVGLPAGYAFEPVGFSKETKRTVDAFGVAFAMSFVFMYLVLAAQFESGLHPVTILISLPLTVPFGLISLWIFGQGINLYTGLGILVLFGVVKKNAILQVDRTNQLREEGHDRDHAIIEANRDRLRPILMTTLAFVAGMVPLVFSKGVGASQNQATAGIVLGGQSLSLLLTLLATPVLYSLFDDAGQWVARLRKKRVPPAGSDAPAQPVEAAS